ncbi:alpha/beta hydrolase [Amycolatopsis sp. BJA-103]|uniref:alpha/beta hydrolase n=1 Tax=Amycolatopsis sp. BJA-103 TaxID=1911175 RepID=UPI000CA358EB|nr:alpha/beta hydrolase [Amycolatopsis sp. BJA-103]AUI59329.1 lipase [Amycolatopsis sp. BJA-103]PNE17227.1 lipase [Amycolatopsis sp. BJA-103]
MTLDPAVKELLARSEPPEAPAFPPTAAELRAAFAASWQAPETVEEVASVTDHVLPSGVRVRLYLPDADGAVPAFVWIHGGGWTIGSIDENEVASRAVCNAAKVAVVAVDYRLAPENPFPAAPDDCYAVVEWLASGGAGPSVDSGRIAIGGESAGGNLSTVVSMMSRDRSGPPLAAQVLICPVYGHPDDGFRSYTDFADGFGMTAGAMRFFFDQYVSDPAQLNDPYLLPLRATDLTGLPPALVLTAEYDVLRDEGEEFARRLADAGAKVEMTRYSGQIHGFYGLYTDLPASPRSHAHVASFLTRVFDSRD